MPLQSFKINAAILDSVSQHDMSMDENSISEFCEIFIVTGKSLYLNHKKVRNIDYH